jgi:hypothetical protein
MDISPDELAAEYRQAKAQWPFITTVNDAYGLPPALLYALGSRETNLQNEIGDGGHGHGMFQLDDRSHHPIPPGFDNDVHAQATMAAQMMKGFYQQYGDWTKACNVYNSGSPDTARTTGGDYGPDVMERQAYLAPLGGLTGKVEASPTLNVRSGPGPDHPVAGTVRYGDVVGISCWTRGAPVTATWQDGSTWTTDVWDRLDQGGATGYVSDAWINTGGDTSKQASSC